MAKSVAKTNLDDIIKKINKEAGSDIVGYGIPKKDYTRITFTSPRMNYCTYGGLPTGRLIEFYGEEHGGKALVNGTPVLTDTGWVAIEKLNVGDKVYGEDGQLHNVIGVYPQGEKLCYDFKLRDGTSVKCSEDHLWSVFTGGQMKHLHYRDCKLNILSTKEMIDNFDRGYYLPDISSMQYEQVKSDDLLLDPYLLGLLLGDGSVCGSTPSISNTEMDIIDSVKSIVSQYGCTVMKYTDKNYSWHIKENKKSNNHPINSAFRYYGLFGKHSHDKFIPNVYKFASIEDRYKLIAGLINTDGCVWGGVEFESTSTQLLRDFWEVCMSLGIYCVLRKHKVRIPASSMTDELLKLLSVKHTMRHEKYLSSHRQHIHKHRRKVESITEVGMRACTCIKVDNPTSLFITKDFIPTHNTTSALDIVANFQQLESVKDEPRRAAYFDAENTLDVEWATKLGVDVDNLILLQPESQSAEEILQIILDMIETGEIGLVVIDSIAAMVSNQEMEKTIEERTYAGISQPLTVFGRKAEMLCKKMDCTIIGINQIRDDLGAMWGGAVKTPGGRAWKHLCLSGNTKFVTDKGLRRFRDCKDGEEVTVVDKDGNLRKAIVNHYGEQFMQKVYLQKGRMKYEVCCTSDHAWILEDGTITHNIKLGDKLYYRERNVEFEIITSRQADMWCLGFAIADGCDYKNKKATGIRAYLYGEKAKYSYIFERASWRYAHQNMGTAYQKLHISKQNFLNGECWKYMQPEDLRYMFMGYMAGDGSGDGCVTHDERVLEFIRYSCGMCNYFISSESTYITNESSKKAGQLAYRVYFTTHDNKYNHWQVYKIEDFGMAGTYCVTEPVTHTFTLEYGVVTGNCSVRMQFTRGNFINEKGDEIKRSSDSPAGNIVLMSMIKNKTCPANRRGGFYTINYALGIDYLRDLIDVAEKYDIIQKAGAWFSIINPDTGDVLADKIQGIGNVYEFLKDEEHEDVLTFIEQYVESQI